MVALWDVLILLLPLLAITVRLIHNLVAVEEEMAEVEAVDLCHLLSYLIFLVVA
jgi:hypothetical protein